MSYKFVALDMDGVLVDTFSSWVWMHEHFNVNNDHSLHAYQRGEIDYKEFMRRDIDLWLAKKKDLTIKEVEEILSTVPLIKGAKEVVAELKKHGIKTIDLVVCNLYPFEETIQKPNVSTEEVIENIDIGGPTLIRASAKNYKDVIVLTKPKQYNEILKILKSKKLFIKYLSVKRKV